MSEKNESTPTPLSECLRIEAALTTDFGRQERLNTYARMADELEAALAQQAGAVDDAARLDWLSQQFRTCTVRMNGDHPWSPGHKVRDLKGQTFRDAIDRAMGAASSAPGGGGECDHAWIDATNEHVSNTAYCSKCGKLSELASAGIVRSLSPKEQV